MEARIQLDTQDAVYRAYVAEGVRASVNNTARFAGGFEMQTSFTDLMERYFGKPAKEQSAEEIIESIKTGLGMLGDDAKKEVRE